MELDLKYKRFNCSRKIGCLLISTIRLYYFVKQPQKLTSQFPEVVRYLASGLGMPHGRFFLPEGGVPKKSPVCHGIPSVLRVIYKGQHGSTPI